VVGKGERERARGDQHPIKMSSLFRLVRSCVQSSHILSISSRSLFALTSTRSQTTIISRRRLTTANAAQQPPVARKSVSTSTATKQAAEVMKPVSPPPLSPPEISLDPAVVPSTAASSKNASSASPASTNNPSTTAAQLRAPAAAASATDTAAANEVMIFGIPSQVIRPVILLAGVNFIISCNIGIVTPILPSFIQLLGLQSWVG
jgi:hypothetical protein